MAYPTQQCITLLARQAKYLPGVPELRVERVAQNHGFSTIRAGRDDIDRHTGQFFNTLDVVLPPAADRYDLSRRRWIQTSPAWFRKSALHLSNRLLPAEW